MAVCYLGVGVVVQPHLARSSAARRGARSHWSATIGCRAAKIFSGSPFDWVCPESA